MPEPTAGRGFRVDIGASDRMGSFQPLGTGETFALPVTWCDSNATDGGFLVPPDMAALIFPFHPRRNLRTGRTVDPTLSMPRRVKKAARKYRDGAPLGTREAMRLWRHHLRRQGL